MGQPGHKTHGQPQHVHVACSCTAAGVWRFISCPQVHRPSGFLGHVSWPKALLACLLYGIIACLHHADRLISDHASIMPLTSRMHSSQHPSYVPANHQQSSFFFIHALSMVGPHAGHTTQTVYASLLSRRTRLCNLHAEQCSLLSRNLSKT